MIRKFCTNCGTALKPDAKFCTSCGAPVQPADAITRPVAAKTASETTREPLSRTQPKCTDKASWSDRFNSFEFQEALAKNKKSHRGCAIYFILAPTVIAPLYGLIVEGADKFFTYLLIGLSISAMFVLFTGIGIIKEFFEKPWEGTVIEKYEKKKRHEERSGNKLHTEWVPYGYLIIRSDDGKKHKIEERLRDARAYHYFKMGDRVRFHAKTKLIFPYEKFDKSKDTEIVCAFCGRRVPIVEDLCPKCHNPLLK